tara:strand:- start:10398 stop:10916 length:519 start_codon:yes stop_codon:yes gene_type:complete
MPIDASTLPISPFLLIAAAGYAAISIVFTGPEIARREIAMSNWQSLCAEGLQANIEATRRPERVLPQVPNIGGMLCSAFPELSDICRMIPDPNTVAREAERRLREAEDARIRRAASGTSDTCTCAEQVYMEDQRLSLALYAASGRLITPPSVENRTVALTRALHSPACQREG